MRSFRDRLALLEDLERAQRGDGPPPYVIVGPDGTARLPSGEPYDGEPVKGYVGASPADWD